MESRVMTCQLRTGHCKSLQREAALAQDSWARAVQPVSGRYITYFSPAGIWGMMVPQVRRHSGLSGSLLWSVVGRPEANTIA